jgi:hypothetical protein
VRLTQHQVLYIDAATLAAFADRPADVVRISPGEPPHRTTTSPHWLTDLHVVRERGLVLVGPPPATLLPPVPPAELMQIVRANLVEWRDGVREARPRGGSRRTRCSPRAATSTPARTAS